MSGTCSLFPPFGDPLAFLPVTLSQGHSDVLQSHITWTELDEMFFKRYGFTLIIPIKDANVTVVTFFSQRICFTYHQNFLKY